MNVPRTDKPLAAFLGDRELIESVYGHGRREMVASMTRLHPEIIESAKFEESIDVLRNAEVIFSTWGMPTLTGEQVGKLSALKALFYAAGTVRSFGLPFLERGITLVSSWHANGVPVAEVTLAQILLAGKGYFRNSREYRDADYYRHSYRGRGNFGEKVALLGAGAIGRKVIDLLRPFNLRILVFDPFLAPEKAVALGVTQVSLGEAFSQAYIVSNHLANLPETVGMLNRPLFESMRPGATFINTGRGATVDEDGMLEALKARPDITALLDVTRDEPPVEGSLLFSLPNIHLSTHIAGSIEDERVRMADYAIEEFRAWVRGEPLRYKVSMEMLDTMA